MPNGGMTDWNRFITQAILKGGLHDKPGAFGPAAAKGELEAVWKYSDGKILSELLELLTQANGVFFPGGGWFIFDTNRILKDNEFCRTDQSCREHCKPFDDILFFADPGGTGDYFGYDLAQPDKPIIRWMAIGDDRDWKAKDLKDLIEGFFSGRIGA